ncbi:MAG TPA: L,D-transpeptidase family protein [Geobacteraceae bacterium]
MSQIISKHRSTINVYTVLILFVLATSSLFAADVVIVDKVLIEKKARRLTLYSKGQAVKSYRVALGRNPAGPKEKEGDNRTPEGTYIIDSRNTKSRFHLALHISYPNAQDIERAKQQGVSPGGDIMIHGILNGFGWIGDLHRWSDWTRGCIAVTNKEIDEIGKLVANGTPVEIKP